MGSIVKAVNLCMTYPGRVPFQALNNVSFEVKQGSFCLIQGRSGSGKSTLLHVLGLLDDLTSGQLYLDQLDVTSLVESQKEQLRLNWLGYIFQEYALLAELTALENVSLPFLVANSGQFARAREEASKYLDAVGLMHRASHLPSELSGGEQQRVAIARAMINQPKVILADEPCANLDTHASLLIMQLLQELNQKYGQTIIMVSHELEDVRYATDSICLKDGQICQSMDG